MELNNFINKNKIDKNKLIKYGFNKKLIYKKDLSNNLYVIYEIINNNCIIKVYDNNFNEEYLPFNIKNNIGNYVSDIKEQADNITKDIIDKCSTKDNIKEKLLKYVNNKYNTIPEYPFKDGISITLTKDKKWYGLIMKINSKKLSLPEDEDIDIINLKNTPEKINEIVDNINIFPAYHMNKKYWITVYLNNLLDENLLYELIDDSYNLISKKK